MAAARTAGGQAAITAEVLAGESYCSIGRPLAVSGACNRSMRGSFMVSLAIRCAAKITAPNRAPAMANLTLSARALRVEVAEVAVSQQMFADVPSLIARPRAPSAPARPADQGRRERPRPRRCAPTQANRRVPALFDHLRLAHAHLPLFKPPQRAILTSRPLGI